MEKELLGYRFPFRPRVRLTSHCNMSCEYCFAVDYLSIPEHKREIKIEDMENILVRCQQEGIDYIAWQGGEPLLHSQINKIIELHKKYNIQAMLFSNGVVEEEKIIALKDIIRSVLINCNEPKTYTDEEMQLLYKNIKMMKALYGDEKVAIGINIYSHEMNTDFILDYALKLGIQEVRVDVTRPAPSNENKFTDFKNINKTFKKVKETINALYANGIKKVHLDCPFPLCCLTEEDQDFVWEFMYDDIKFGQCRTYLDITTDMKISSCFCSIPFNEIGVNEFDSLTHAWLFIKSIEDNYRWNVKTIEKCETCDFSINKICQGGCLGYKIKNSQIIDEEYMLRNVDSIKESMEEAHIYIKFHMRDFDTAYNLLQEGSYNQLELLKLYIYSCIYLKKEEFKDDLLGYIKNHFYPASAAHELAVILMNNGYHQEAIEVAELGVIQEKNVPRNKYKLHDLLSCLYTSKNDAIKAKLNLMDSYRIAPSSIRSNMFAKTSI